MQCHALIKRTLPSLGLAIGVTALPVPVLALDFDFPAAASQSFDRREAFSSYALPIGPFLNGVVKTLALEGAVFQKVWTIPAQDVTTLQILAPVRDQLIAAGFVVLFECETAACGGFDFRFGVDIAAEPAMHVDLGDFRYLAAKRSGPDGPDHVAVIVSRSSKLGFVQITEVGKGQAAAEPLVTPTTKAPEQPTQNASTPLGDGLAKQGSVALDDLIFASGASDLAPGEYASLEALAAYLRSNPSSKVALVGHTDASGGLAGNIALSRARAASVRVKMIANYAIPTEQIISEGAGYLSPRDSNLTDQGRTRNRRVEVMLLVDP